MAAEWPTITLQEAGVALIDCEHKTPPAAVTGYPYVAIPQLQQGRLELKEARRISRDHLIEWTRRAKPQQYDVILSRRCNPGETAVVPPGVECAVGQNLVLLRADGKRVFPPFLRWAVRGPAWWEQIGKFLNVGAVFDSLRCADVPRFELPIPPLADQRAVAHILGTLDDKIELNRRKNQTLEAIARALFKSWFVDFDPVRAKAAGGQPAGMDAETAALFPSEFVDSEIGEIPKGWSVGPLGTVMELKRGYDLPLASRQDGSVPIFSSSGHSGYHNKAMARAPGIVTGRYGTIGRVYLVREDFWPLNTTLYVRNLKGSNVLFAYHLLDTMDFQKFSDKAAVPGVNRNDLHEEPVIVPPRSLQVRFGELAASQLELAGGNESQMAVLAQIRDALLPRLLSGELPIPNAERIVEATT